MASAQSPPKARAKPCARTREVEELFEQRELQQAEERATKLRPARMGHSCARRLLRCKALIAKEFGEFGVAADHLEAAIQRRGDGDPWLVAELAICEHRYSTQVDDDAFARKAAGLAPREPGAARQAKDKRAIRADLDRRLKDPDLTEAAQAATCWALGVILSGPDADDGPDRDEIERSGELLHRALTTSGRDERVLVALARWHWVDARFADTDPAGAVENALAHIAEFEGGAVSKELRAAVAYYQGRILLVNHDFAMAAEKFEGVLEIDPGHQAGLAWAAYSDRMLHGNEAPERVLERIDGLIGAGTAGRPAPVFDRALVAELETERGVLLAHKDPRAAGEAFRRALRTRPRMTFAQRRLVRAIAASGRAGDAVDEGEKWIGFNRELGSLSAELLADVAVVYTEVAAFEEAIGLLDEAERLAPTYAFTYAARCGARRQQAERDGPELLELARREATHHLATVRDVSPRHHRAGLECELGAVLCMLGEYAEAMRHFRSATVGTVGIVRDAALAGVVDVHRLSRRFTDAVAVVEDAEETPGAATLMSAGWVYAELGRFPEAYACHTEALELDPPSPQAVIAMARTLRVLGRPTQAAKVLEENAVPEHRRGFLLNDRGWVALELGRPREAREHFRAALKQYPFREAAWRGLVAAAGKLRVPWNEIETLLEQSREKLGDRPNVLAEAAFAALRRGDVVEAHALLARAEELAGDQPGIGLRVNAANELIDAAALPEAARLVDWLEHHAAGDPHTMLLRARLHTALGDLERASAAYSEAGEAWPDSCRVLLGRASVEYARGDLSASEETIRRALGSDAEHTAAREMLAWALMAMHDAREGAVVDSDGLEEAARACDAIRRVEPTRTGALECLAAIAASSGQLAAAKVYLLEAERHGDEHPDAACNRAVLYHRLGLLEEAMATVKPVLAERPAPRARVLLGLCCLELKRPEAVDHLRLAFRQDSRDGFALLALAMALAEAGRDDEALAALTQGMRTVPVIEHAPLLLARARIIYEQAIGLDGHERDALLDEALLDVGKAEAVARRSKGLAGSSQRVHAADLHYHRGVILYRRGRRRAARQAFTRATRADEHHAEAKRALALIPRGSEPGEARTARRWGNALAATAAVLMVGTLVLAVAQADWHPTDLEWTPAAWVVAGWLVAFVVGVSLPRLAGMELGRQVRITLTAPVVPEPSSGVSLHLRALAPLTAKFMAGPGGYVRSDLPSTSV